MRISMCTGIHSECQTVVWMCAGTLATEAKTSGKYHHFQVKFYVFKGPPTIMRFHRNGTCSLTPSLREYHSLIPFRSLIPWRQCLLSRGTEACSLGLRETPACIHVIQRLSQPRVACWHGFRPNSQKTECVFTRCPTCGRKKNCVYTRPPKRKGLTGENWKKNCGKILHFNEHLNVRGEIM